jgi:hypothetical protein
MMDSLFTVFREIISLWVNQQIHGGKVFQTGFTIRVFVDT